MSLQSDIGSLKAQLAKAKRGRDMERKARVKWEARSRRLDLVVEAARHVLDDVDDLGQSGEANASLSKSLSNVLAQWASNWLGANIDDLDAALHALEREENDE